MSTYYNAERKSEKKSPYKSPTKKFGGSKTTSTLRSGEKYGAKRPANNSRTQKREVKKFDPSMFLKKVEETVMAPVYIPKNNFSDFLIEEQLKKNILDKGYKTPTPIQDQVIPIALAGNDVIATANTGTGKTAAFLIPLINNVLTKKTTRALIIAPTRELAVQIRAELDSFKNKTGLTSALCIGGSNMHVQINDLKKDPAFVIGTPGRLLDLEKNNIINFRNYNALVLDEVDTMCDMGFLHVIKYIVTKLPSKRHSLFFSATIPTTLKKVIDGFLNNPIAISVKTRQSAENVNQDVIRVNPTTKIDTLHDLLIKPEFKKIIIFSRTKRAADKLSKTLAHRGFKISTIHGDKSQPQRQKALTLFKDNKVNILLATDVVARGIDIDNVSHVINYDLPQTYEDYIHRIGRTGRADKVGQAITFVE